MTLFWFVIWFVADRVGDREALVFDPVNVWAGTFVLALALDVNRAGGIPGRSSEPRGGSAISRSDVQRGR